MSRVLDEFGPESLKPGFFGGLAFDALENCSFSSWASTRGHRLGRHFDPCSGRRHHHRAGRHALRHRPGQGDAGDSSWRYSAIAASARWSCRRRAGAKTRPTSNRRSRASRPTRPTIRPRPTRRTSTARRPRTELPGLLEKWGGSSFREDIEQDLAEARTLLPYRESGKYYLMMGYELIRLVLQELGRRWDLGNDLYFLQLGELARFDKERPATAGGDRPAQDPLAGAAAARHAGDRRLTGRSKSWIAAAGGLGQRVCTATTLAPGVAVGTARIVDNPQEVGDLGSDYVLVCPSTDPGWTPLFMHARGLIVERGGVLSHGAIVARDFGIPAVACPSATKLLQDGDSVRVDGNQGVVVILERKK